MVSCRHIVTGNYDAAKLVNLYHSDRSVLLVTQTSVNKENIIAGLCMCYEFCNDRLSLDLNRNDVLSAIKTMAHSLDLQHDNTAHLYAVLSW